jgi:hypothetical protein
VEGGGDECGARRHTRTQKGHQNKLGQKRKGAKRSGREAGHKAKTNESGPMEASGPPNVGSRSKSGNGSGNECGNVRREATLQQGASLQTRRILVSSGLRTVSYGNYGRGGRGLLVLSGIYMLKASSEGW